MATRYILFASATLLEFGRNQSGGHMKFRADLSDKICEGMGWSRPNDKETKVTLEGDLYARVLLLTPKEKEFAKHALELAVTRASSFVATRKELEKSRGKGHRHELTFQVEFAAEGIAGQLEDYLLTCGGQKGSCKISYDPQPKQMEIPDEDERLISRQQALETAEED